MRTPEKRSLRLLLCAAFCLLAGCLAPIGGTGERGTPSPPPGTPARYASRFGFTDAAGGRLALVYVGRLDETPDPRARFEADRFQDVPPGDLAEFGECDLGGTELVLVVPRYREMTVRVTEIDAAADALATGREVGRFGDGRPFYLACPWDRSYDIQVEFQGSAGFFHADRNMFEACRTAENGYIV